MSREELLESAFGAIVALELPVRFPGGASLDDDLGRGLTWRSLIIGAISAIRRNPSFFAAWFNSITVRPAQFNKWLNKTHKRPRGPERDTTGYKEADRRVFPQISRLIKAGKARSPYGAALVLAGSKKLAGHGGPVSQAKRVTKLFNKEHRH